MSTPSNNTVDCVSWEPVEIKKNNQQVSEPEGKSWISKQQVETVGIESREHRNKSFAHIFHKNVWGGGAGQKRGGGSLLVNAGKIINVLNVLIDKIKNNSGKNKIR